MSWWQTHHSYWFGYQAVMRMLLCSWKQALKQQISNLTYFKKKRFLLILAFRFSFHISFWSYTHFSRCCWILAFESRTALATPRDARKKFQSTLVSCVGYSAHAHYPLLAFVTLMHWLGNICGMLIPWFQRRCRIPTYCLSSTVSQLVCRVIWRVTRFPHRKQGKVDELALANAKSPLRRLAVL